MIIIIAQTTKHHIVLLLRQLAAIVSRVLKKTPGIPSTFYQNSDIGCDLGIKSVRIYKIYIAWERECAFLR